MIYSLKLTDQMKDWQAGYARAEAQYENQTL